MHRKHILVASTAVTFTTILLTTFIFNIGSTSAILTQEQVEKVKGTLGKAFNEIKSDPAAVQSDLQQANQTLRSFICNSAICQQPGTIKSVEADTVRVHLNQALNAIRGGSSNATRDQIIQANQSLAGLRVE